MKLGLAPLLASSLVSLAACDVHRPDPIGAPVETPPQEAPVAAKRTLVAGTSLPTSAVNLLTDPGFALVGQESGYGAFLAFYAKTFAPFTPYAAVDSRSPAGFGGATLFVRPARATDEKSDALLLLTSFPGGKGPFTAEVWASKATVKDDPREMPADGSALKVTIASGSPEGGGFDLTPDFTQPRTSAGRTWVRYRGDVGTPLTEGAFFVITTGTGGGNVLLAAPSVTSAEVTVGGQLQTARRNIASLHRRALSSIEQEAISRYKAIPPRLKAAADATSRPPTRAGL